MRCDCTQRTPAGEAGGTDASPAGPSGRWKNAAYALAAAAAVTLLLAGRGAGRHLPGFVAWVADLGPWGPAAFIVGYALATVAFVPGSVLTLAAGAIFGLPGALYAFLGASAGAAASFLMARHLARARIERRFAGQRRFQLIDRAIGEGGGRMVALLRLSPVVPFSLLNYGLGLTGVSLRSYLVASLAMFPGTLPYAYYGWVAGDLATASAGRGDRSLLDWAVVFLGLVAALAVTVLVTRKARRALARAEAHHG